MEKKLIQMQNVFISHVTEVAAMGYGFICGKRS